MSAKETKRKEIKDRSDSSCEECRGETSPNFEFGVLICVWIVQLDWRVHLKRGRHRRLNSLWAISHGQKRISSPIWNNIWANVHIESGSNRKSNPCIYNRKIFISMEFQWNYSTKAKAKRVDFNYITNFTSFSLFPFIQINDRGV